MKKMTIRIYRCRIPCAMKYGVYAACFFLPFFLYLLLLLRFDIAPFGDKTAFVADDGIFRSYVAFHRFLKNGGSLFYAAGLGGASAGDVLSVAFSPLSYLLIFVKESRIISALSFISALKCGAAGLFTALLLRRASRLSIAFLPTFSVFYALGAPTLSLSTAFLYSDFALYLPLLFFTFLVARQQRGGAVYALVLALALASEPRAILFFAILLLFAFASAPWRKSVLFYTIGFTVGGALLSLVSVIPALLLYAEQSATADFRWFTIPISSALTTLFSGSFAPFEGGALLLSLGTPVLLLLPVFFATRRLSPLRRIAAGALLFILLSGAVLFPIYKVLSFNLAFGYLPPYGAVLLLFFALLFVSEAMPRRASGRGRAVALCSFGGLLLLLTLFQKLHIQFLSADQLPYYILHDIYGVWLSILSGLAVTVCLYIGFECTSAKLRRYTSVALLCTVCISSFLCADALSKNLLYERTAEPYDDIEETLALNRAPSLQTVDGFASSVISPENTGVDPLSRFLRLAPYACGAGSAFSSVSAAVRMNERISAVLGTPFSLADPVTVPAYTRPENFLDELDQQSVEGYTMYRAENAKDFMLLSVKGNGDALYFELPSPEKQSLVLTVNGTALDYTDGHLYIGTPEADEEYQISLTLNDGAILYFPDNFSPFFTVSEEDVDTALSLLSDSSSTVKRDGAGITAELLAPSDMQAFTFIPFDGNFVLEIDGECTPFTQDQDGYITFPLKKGAHTLTLNYRTRGATVGFVLSACSLVLIVGYCICERIVLKKKGAEDEDHSL